MMRLFELPIAMANSATFIGDMRCIVVSPRLTPSAIGVQASLPAMHVVIITMKSFGPVEFLFLHLHTHPFDVSDQ
jgi:hypothetical protein